MAPTNTVALRNMSLSAIGTRARISSPSEVSRENEVCQLWEEHVIDYLLSGTRWYFATAHRRLAVLATRDTIAHGTWEPTDPDPGWTFAYKAPEDMVRPRFLTNYERFDIGQYNDQRAIFCNQEDALFTYTKQVNNASFWEPQFRQAFIHSLAAHISQPLLGKPGRAEAQQELANNIILEARAIHANDSFQPLDKVPDWIAARGYSGSVSNPTEYVYPDAQLLAMTGLT